MFNKKKEKSNPSVKDLKTNIYDEKVFDGTQKSTMPLPSRIPTPKPHGVEFEAPFKIEPSKVTTDVPMASSEDTKEIMEAFSDLMDKPVGSTAVLSRASKQTSKPKPIVGKETGSKVVKDANNVKLDKGYIEPNSWEQVTDKVKPPKEVAFLKKEENKRVQTRKSITGNYNPAEDSLLKERTQGLELGSPTNRVKVHKDKPLSNSAVVEIAKDLNKKPEEVVAKIEHIKKQELKTLEVENPKALEPVTSHSRSNPMSRQMRRKGKVKRHINAEEEALELARKKEEEAKAQQEKLAKEKAEQETKEKARLEAEAKAKKEAEEKAKKEAEEKAKKEAEAKAKKEAEEKAKREAKEKAKKEAKEKAKKEAEEKELIEKVDKAKRDEELKSQKEVETQGNSESKAVSTSVNTDIKLDGQSSSTLKESTTNSSNGLHTVETKKPVIPIEYTKYSIKDFFIDNTQAIMVAVYTLGGTPLLWYAVEALKKYL